MKRLLTWTLGIWATTSLVITGCSSISMGEAKSVASVKSPSFTRKINAVTVQLSENVFAALPDDQHQRELFLEAFSDELSGHEVQTKTPEAKQTDLPILSLLAGKVAYSAYGEPESADYEVRIVDGNTQRILYRALIHHVLGDISAGPENKARVLAKCIVRILMKDGIIE